MEGVEASPDEVRLQIRQHKANREFWIKYNLMRFFYIQAEMP